MSPSRDLARRGDDDAALDGEPTLDELAETVKAEHALVMGAMQTTLEHAILCGEALLKARAITLPRGEWTQWLAENFPKHRSSASKYMRVAVHKALIPNDVTEITPADELLAGLPTIDGGPGRARATGSKKSRAIRMREEKPPRPYKKIAKELRVSVSTVHSWINEGTKKRRDREAEEALREKERDKEIRRAVRATGGALAEAYSMAERIDDVIGQAHRETEDHRARQELARAHEFQRAMRDSVVRALGVDDG